MPRDPALLPRAGRLALALPLVAALAACSTPPPPVDALAGTRWQLEVLQSMADEVPPARPASPGLYTLSFEPDGRAVLRLDCNRGQATWQAQPAPDATPRRRAGSLAFGPLASTRAACAPGSLAPRLARELPAVRSFVIEGGRLHLALMADGGIQTWSPWSGDSP